MKTIVLVVSLFMLAGCAVKTPYVMGQTPSMVTVCSGSTGWQSTLNTAQEQCATYGKSAEVIPSNDNTRCSQGSLKGWVHNFKCN